MSITITTTGQIVKPRKARQPRKAKVNRSAEKRIYPSYREGMSTLDYIHAYHAANASVYLTMVEYTCH